MTNDDRNQEPPRYGERTSPEQGGAPRYEDQPTQQYQQPSAPQGTPQWGQQQQPGQQYGQPQHYGQPQQYGGQQQDGGAPAWNSSGEPAKKKKTVGVIAFAAAVVALVIGVIGGYMLGTALTSSQVLQDFAQNGGSGTTDTQELQRRLMQDPQAMSGLGTGSVLMLIGSVFGLWAIVQGIVAIVTKRGRVWGVLAIVLAVLAAVVAGAVYVGVAASSLNGM
jgi:hypothetical protein